MKSLLVGLLSHALLLVAVTASAEVRHEGAWPEADKKVTLDVDGAPRGVAVRKLADAAGWSLVVQTSFAADPADKIDVHVKDQPAGKVLDLVLAGEQRWVAKRDGTLVSLQRDATPAVAPSDAAAAADPHAGMASPQPPQPPEPPEPPAIHGVPPIPPIPPIPPVPPVASGHGKHGRHGDRGEDRVITGGNLVVEKNEVAHDITLFGGNLDVLGKVTGDISVTGGNVVIRPGAKVHGDVATIGGSLTVEDGAEVEGDVGVVGGVLHRGKNAQIGGDITRTDNDDSDSDEPKHGSSRSSGFLHEVGHSITRAAFLFIFGVLLLALATKRMESLRAESATRPMRSLALGIIAIPAAIVAAICLCVTVIGIPVAILGLMLLIFGGYAGIIAILTTIGEALLRHKTPNTYVHLAAGCALLLVTGAIPVVGPIVFIAICLAGVGVVVATRGAGLLPNRSKVSAGPYRTPA